MWTTILIIAATGLLFYMFFRNRRTSGNVDEHAWNSGGHGDHQHAGGSPVTTASKSSHKEHKSHGCC
jgi:hypothetical protein